MGGTQWRLVTFESGGAENHFEGGISRASAGSEPDYFKEDSRGHFKGGSRGGSVEFSPREFFLNRVGKPCILKHISESKKCIKQL